METETYNVSYSKVFNSVLQIINELGLSKESINKDEGEIVAFTGSSLLSWGEKITIQLTKVKKQTRVSVSSEPKAQLFDWGKSEENEKMIIVELDNFFGGC